jgi:hypothetical protein
LSLPHIHGRYEVCGGAQAGIRPMTAKININGQEYNSVDEMPPDVRKAWEQAMSMLADRNGNGVPDILEGGNTRITRSSSVPGVTTVVTSSTVTVNGRKYDNWEEVPPDLRSMLSQSGAVPFASVNSGSSLRLTSTGPRNTITFQITPSTLLALLAAIGLALLIGWFFFGR